MAGDRADRETAHCQFLYFWFLYTMNVWLIQKINGYFKNVNKPWHTLNQLGNTIKTPNVDFFPVFSDIQYNEEMYPALL